jgi:hypothetical protein
VTPTALAIAALTNSGADGETAARIRAGRRFLLAHAAQAGGWNHGSIRVFDIEGEAYPETTGIALVGLRGVRAPAVAAAIERARDWLVQARSAQSWAWLKLGLLAHGVEAGGAEPPARPANACECALALLALQARPDASAFWAQAPEGVRR